MFRLLKVRPPHGWNAVAWELAIVTLGVLMALGAQQWADERSWRQRATAARRALGEELSYHYLAAIEWRMAAPCISAQLDQLQERVLGSRGALDPAPLYADKDIGSYKYVIRTPSRPYADSVWQNINSTGVSSYLDQEEQLELGWHYKQAKDADGQNEQITLLASRLGALSKPLAVDPGVKLSLIQTIDELRGNNRWMNIKVGQLVDHIVKLRMVPPRDSTEKFLVTSEALKFCRKRGLPTLPIDEALVPIPS
jgi:hypothetical protein